MEKNLITIKKTDGTTKEMEVVLTFCDDITRQNYILYKEPDNNNECYAAKYTQIDDTFNLDTNLTQKELNALEYILAKSLEVN